MYILLQGVTMIIKGKETTIKGAVLLVLADTLAAHSIGGFKIGVGFSLRKCRLCLATKDQMSINVSVQIISSFQHIIFIQFRSDAFIPRTPESYNYQCHLLDGPLSKDTSIIYGINYSSPLNKLTDFHVVTQLPMDIMHVLLEGVIPYELSLLLHCFIAEKKFFSITTLNDYIASFEYSTQEAKNKPSLIKSQSLSSNGLSLNQSCKHNTVLICKNYV